MKLNYFAYLPEHEDELDSLGEAYIVYHLHSQGCKDMLTEKEFIFNRASPELLKALKELEVRVKKRQIDEDFKA